MLVTKKITVTEERDVVDDVLCNVCGNSLNQGECGPEGIVELEMTFGYDSRLFGDMTRVKFSVCEGCLFGWSRTWKYDPIDPEDDWWTFWKDGCICRHPAEGSGWGSLVEEDCPVHGNDAPGVTRVHCDPNKHHNYSCVCAGNVLNDEFYRTENNPACRHHGDRRG